MCDEATHVYGEAPIVAGVHSARQATPEQLCELAQLVWKEVTRSGVAPDDDAGNEALLEALHARHEDFGKSFPLVLRWMVHTRQFRAKAFAKFVRVFAKAATGAAGAPRSREDFLKLQGEYLVLLWRELNPRAGKAAAAKYREEIVAMLLAEDKAFSDIQEEVDRDFAAQAQAADADRRQRLYAHLIAQKTARERDGDAGLP
jgi:hypothetical protein